MQTNDAPSSSGVADRIILDDRGPNLGDLSSPATEPLTPEDIGEQQRQWWQRPADARGYKRAATPF